MSDVEVLCFSLPSELVHELAGWANADESLLWILLMGTKGATTVQFVDWGMAEWIDGEQYTKARLTAFGRVVLDACALISPWSEEEVADARQKIRADRAEFWSASRKNRAKRRQTGGFGHFRRWLAAVMVILREHNSYNPLYRPRRK